MSIQVTPRERQFRAVLGSAVITLLTAVGVLAGSAVSARALHANDCEENVCNLDSGNCVYIEKMPYNCDEESEEGFGGCSNEKCT